MSEKENMINGKFYNAGDEELHEGRLRARDLCKQFNCANARDLEYRNETLKTLFGSLGEKCFIESPFICDYGFNVYFGDNSYANFNLTILDEGPVRIGKNVMIGPNVQLLTACHPIVAEERNSYIEYTKAIEIKDNVWLGGGVVITPGVTIGENCVIGAGSVVTKDIPDNVVAAGNPCRILRKITDADRILK